VSRVNFEVLRDAGTGWHLESTFPVKEQAEAEARAIMAKGRSRAVRVMRSAYNPATTTFIESETLFLGERPKASRDGGPVSRVFPCWRPTDFYDLQGRLAIGRALKDSLERWHLTPLELIHNAEHVLRLNDTQTVLQAAVQRTAIAQTQGTDKTAQARMRELYDVIAQASAPLYAEARKPRHPRIADGNYGAFLAAIRDSKEWRYNFFLGLADHLQPCNAWEPKVEVALTLLAASEGDARVVEALDAFFGEMTALTRGLAVLIGKSDSDAERLRRLARLLKAEAADWPNPAPVYEVLRGWIAAGTGTDIRRALGHQIADGVGNGRSLTDGDLLAEARAVGTLHRAMRQEDGTVFGGDEMEDAFIKRCEGFTQSWKLSEMLNGVEDPRLQLSKLFDLAAEVVGSANRRRLGDIMLEIVNNPPNEAKLAPSDGAAMDNLNKLARLQKRAIACDLAEHHRKPLGEAMDRLQYGLIQRLKLFARLESAGGDEVDHARRLLDFIDKGTFTRGQALNAAKAVLTRYLRSPAFLDRFVARLPAEQRISSLVQFRNQLQKYGINATGE